MSAPRQAPGGRVGIVENWELRQHKSRDANSGAFKGLLFVGVTLVLITIGGWYASRPMVGPFLTDTFEEHPGIINYPVIGDVVAAEFAEILRGSEHSRGARFDDIIRIARAATLRLSPPRYPLQPRIT